MGGGWRLPLLLSLLLLLLLLMLLGEPVAVLSLAAMLESVPWSMIVALPNIRCERDGPWRLGLLVVKEDIATRERAVLSSLPESQ